MQSAPVPGEHPRPTVPPVFGELRLPADIRLGFALMIFGLAFTAVSVTWPFFLAGALPPSDLALYMQISLVVGLVQSLSASLGLALVFRGVLRFLPRIGPWPRLGPLLIFVGALLFGAGYAGMILFASFIFPPYGGSLSGEVYALSGLVGLAGEIITVIGGIVSLFAVARGVVAQHRDLLAPVGL